MMKPEVISTNKAPSFNLPFSQGWRFGNLVFVSGTVAADPETGEIVGDTIQAQTHQVMRNIAAILETTGTSLDNVLKTTCFLSDLNMFPAFNEVYGSYFNGPPPARSTFQVGALAPGVLVEIEAIAAIPTEE